MSDINVVDRIKIIMNQKGINISDLATRCGFKVPKMSKILSGEQKITTEDLIIIGYALGTNPALLVSPNMSDVEWSERKIVPICVLLNKINESKDDEDNYSELLENELTYTIGQYLSLKDSGKTVYALAKRRRINADSSAIVPVPRVLITDRREGQLFSNQLTVGYWFTEDRQYAYLAIHYMKKAPTREKAAPLARRDMKDYFRALFPANNSINGEEIMHLEKSGHNMMGAGTIICKKYELKVSYSEEKLKQDLHEMYDAYLMLLDVATKRVQETYENIYQSRLEQERKEKPELNGGSFDISDLDRIMPIETVPARVGQGARLRRFALEREHYRCELNPEHETFIDRSTGKNYMEGHRLIPYMAQSEFKNSLNVEANMCCVCPNCHARLERASDSERQELLMQLYLKHKDMLKNAGIEITPLQLFKFYGMN